MKKTKKILLLGTFAGMLFVSMIGCGKKEELDDKNTGSEAVSAGQSQIEDNTTEAITEATTEATTETDKEESTDLFADSGLTKFEIKSEDLHDGAWDPVIANVDGGLNVSPQLSWDDVPEATSYVIFMVDISAGNWLHWKSNNVTETELTQGWATTEEYIGPYPGKGSTHNYDIYIFALKQPVDEVKGTFNASSAAFYNNALGLDAVVEGSSGNIISYGHLSGTYTREK